LQIHCASSLQIASQKFPCMFGVLSDSTILPQCFPFDAHSLSGLSTTCRGLPIQFCNVQSKALLTAGGSVQHQVITYSTESADTVVHIAMSDCDSRANEPDHLRGGGGAGISDRSRGTLIPVNILGGIQNLLQVCSLGLRAGQPPGGQSCRSE